MELDTANIYADEQMMEIVLRNLLTNAIKYSNNDGVITLSSYSEKGNVYITVADQGMGIPEELKNQLFTSELVKSQQGTAGEKGTGLGLDLSKEFIDKHNGEIKVASELGQGSRFTIALPQSKS